MIDPVLVIVTIVSLCLASVMSVITWHVLRRERRRDEVGDAEALPAPPKLFVRADLPTSHGRRLTTAVALGTAVVIAALGILTGFSPSPPDQPGLSPAAARVRSPLELVTLDHAREGQRLSIHGLVRNPSSGGRVEDLVVVVFLFDRRGEYVATIQAPLAERVLEPGAESAFDIPIRSGLNVSRYRLTFRIARGPVPHIDRRATPPEAPPPPSGRAAIVRHASVITATADGTPVYGLHRTE